MKQQVSTVITDIDNTLFDWVEIWHQPFNAMYTRLIEDSGLPEDVLSSEIRAVHQLHGTSEYRFLIEELPSLRAKHPGEDLVQVYGGAIEAYRAAREEVIRLYPGVSETLHALHDKGCLIVAYTESMAFYTNYRVGKLGLDALIDILYSPKDHTLPRGLTEAQTRQYAKQRYEFDRTEHRYTPEGELKPNPKLLLDIIDDVGARFDRTVYVGDSLMKDIAMAQDARVIDVYAKYGMAQQGQAYEMLRRVTHWTDEDVEREKRIYTRGEVAPTYVLERSFDELLTLFDFVPFENAQSVGG
jgi:phosphoglycolate phosphatase-like HAD superfamily hydrolase